MIIDLLLKKLNKMYKIYFGNILECIILDLNEKKNELCKILILFDNSYEEVGQIKFWKKKWLTDKFREGQWLVKKIGE